MGVLHICTFCNVFFEDALSNVYLKLLKNCSNLQFSFSNRKGESESLCCQEGPSTET